MFRDHLICSGLLACGLACTNPTFAQQPDNTKVNQPIG